MRIHVEQSFGILVARFGILWKPVRYQLPVAPRILFACMRIHNFCIDNGVEQMSTTQDIVAASETQEAFVGWWSNAEHIRDHTMKQGRRTDMDTGSKRDYMADMLHEAGLFSSNVSLLFLLSKT
jgi:hypothetical protein